MTNHTGGVIWGSPGVPSGQTSLVSSWMNIYVHNICRYSLFKWSRNKVGGVPQLSISAIEDVLRC